MVQTKHALQNQVIGLMAQPLTLYCQSAEPANLQGTTKILPAMEFDDEDDNSTGSEQDQR